MEKLEKLYKDLEKYKNFDENPENTEFFLNTADQIVWQQNPKSIAVLLKYFDDDSDYSWVFQSLMIALEHFDKKNRIFELLTNLKDLINRAPMWADEIFSRIFNNTKSREIFRENLHLAPKESLLKLFDIMEEESPHHQKLIAQLREELEKSPPPGDS